MNHLRALTQVLAATILLSCASLVRAQHEHHGDHPEPAREPATAPGPAYPAPVVPEPTDAERAQAFPDVGDMHAGQHMDAPVMFSFLLDQLEWMDADEGDAYRWDGRGWLGNDERRLWMRTEGERSEDELESAELQLLYGKPIAPYWDVVAGLRHDFEPGPSQTWLGLGVQGTAPYFFETEVGLYVGEGGQTNLRLEGEYDLLLTNRLILQPQLEVNVYGKDDPERGIGSGLARSELGLRLRYEIRRELAPYMGVVREKLHGDTADLAGHGTSDTALVMGVRLWY